MSLTNDIRSYFTPKFLTNETKQPENWKGRALSAVDSISSQMTLKNLAALTIFAGTIFSGYLIAKGLSTVQDLPLNPPNPTPPNPIPQPSLETLSQFNSQTMAFNTKADFSPINYVPLNNIPAPITNNEVILSENIEQLQNAAQSLKIEVETALLNGGKFVSKSNPDEVGTGGAYLIKNNEGKIIALFKPEDEGIWRPNCPNPAYRKHAHSEEDVFFHHLNSWEQGDQGKRQQFAELLFMEGSLRIPKGAMVEMTSDLFVDLDAQAKGLKPKVQTKRGYLQEWIGDTKPLIFYHPSVKPGSNPPSTALDFSTNPILDQISLDEFQEIAIMDMLMYNEDRNVGNLLVKFNEDNIPSLVPIDHDAILPWKMKSLFGMYKHNRINQPLTPATLKFIEKLDPDYIEILTAKMDISEQAPLNAKAIAMTIKQFAAAGATLKDIEKFISFGDRGKYSETSEFWKLSEKAMDNAIDKLPAKDKSSYKHNHYLRRAEWCKTKNVDWCRPLPIEEQASSTVWRNNYLNKKAANIEAQIKTNFWDEINLILEKKKTLLKTSANP